MNDGWFVPVKYAKYVCLNNYNHSFQGDKPFLSLICPVCGGVMELDNLEDFE